MTDETLKSTIAQTHLAGAGHYRARIDGDWGPISRDSARAWFAAHAASLIAAVIPRNRRLLTGTPTNEHLRVLAAQLHLSRAELYPGALDLIWGPLSRAAARAWHTAHHPPVTRHAAQTPYDVAQSLIGTREIPGREHNWTIVRWLRALAAWINDDETAWCSAFVAHCAREAGYEYEGATVAARSWLRVGQPILATEARRGDVVIFSRGDPNGWTGHVGFVHELTGSTIYVLGGNQNNAVNILGYRRENLLGFRRLRSLDQLQGPSNKI
jgi:uncharacterized protein (TIGR02594 family)